MSSEQREVAVEKETGRIEAFSDGVFAVAITLLVFDLKVPQLPQGAISVAALGMALFKEWPSYLTFVTSFATILIMWVGHNNIFKLVYRSSTPFLFANGLLLLLVTVVPFPTSLVAAYLTTQGGGKLPIPSLLHSRPYGSRLCRLCRYLCCDQCCLQPALVDGGA